MSTADIDTINDAVSDLSRALNVPLTDAQLDNITHALAEAFTSVIEDHEG